VVDIATGHLDQLAGNCLTGWAWNSTHPALKTVIYVFVNQILVGKVLARDFRKDLLHAGIGDGCHGFNFIFDKITLNKGDAIEAVIMQHGRMNNLHGGPIQVVIPTTNLAGEYTVRNDGLVHGWIKYETCNPPTNLTIEINGQRAASLLLSNTLPVATANRGLRKSYFEHLIDKIYVSNDVNLIRVTRSDTGFALHPQEARLSYGESYFGYQYKLESSRLNKRRSMLSDLREHPCISVLLPTYNSNIEYLDQAIQSVRCQSYRNWQLCIADDNSTSQNVRALIRRHAIEDPRICTVFRRSNGNISAATNSALEMANGCFTALLDHDDLLDEDALLHIAYTMNNNPDVSMIFSDEDKCNTNGQRYEPYHKLGWNPELMLGQNCVSHLGAFRTSLLRHIGGFRSLYDGAQDYDLVLRASLHIPANQIVHIPAILYHWRAVPGSTALSGSEKDYAATARRRAARCHLDERGLKGRLISDRFTEHLRFKPALPRNKIASVIIDYKGSRCNLSILLQSIKASPALEIEIIVVTDSIDKPPGYLFDALPSRKLQWRKLPPTSSTIQAYFQAVNELCSDVVIWIDSDVIPCKINPGWLNELISQALRMDLAFIGPKIIDEAGRIVSFGLDTGNEGEMLERFAGLHADEYGPLGIARLARNVKAVSNLVFAVKSSLLRSLIQPGSAAMKSDEWVAELCERAVSSGVKNLVTPSCLFMTKGR
jgi:GT2 family glycosyltransferase